MNANGPDSTDVAVFDLFGTLLDVRAALATPAARIAFPSANPRGAHGAASNELGSIRVDRSGLPDEALPGCPAHRVGALADLPPSALR